MPTYDMECRNCGTRFERFLSRLLREEDKRCEGCGSDDVFVRPSAGFISGGKGQPESRPAPRRSC